jgi:hypothetical protein
VTYLNDKAKPLVDPLAKRSSAHLHAADLQREGQLRLSRAVEQRWGTLDLCSFHRLRTEP